MELLTSIEDLTEFFGVAPKMEYADLPLERNAVEFDVELENSNVWFNFFAPGSFAELRIRGTPFSIVKLTFSSVSQLSVRKTAEDHYLQLQFASAELEPFRLRVRPRLFVTWGNDVGGLDKSHLEVVG